MGGICWGFLEFTVPGEREIPLPEARAWRSIRIRLWLHPGLSPKLGGAQQTPGRAAAASPTPSSPEPESPPAQSPIPSGRFILPETLSSFFDPCSPLLQGLVTSCSTKIHPAAFAKPLPTFPGCQLILRWKALSNFPLLTSSRAPLMFI